MTKDDRCLIKGIRTEKKWGRGKRLIKEFPNNTTTSLAYFLKLRITVTFVVAYRPLTSVNQTCSVDISSSVCFTTK